MKTIKVRRKTPMADMVWYDGTNVVEIARWLQERGQESNVAFRPNGKVYLSINGYSRDIPSDHDGIWIDPQGAAHQQSEIDEFWTDEP